MATLFEAGIKFDMDDHHLDTPLLGDNKVYTYGDNQEVDPITTIQKFTHPVRSGRGTLKPLVGRGN